MKKWIVWGLSTLFYFYEVFLQVSPNAMGDQWMHAFHINGAELGYITSFYFYPYLLMQIPVGILLSRFGPRKLLTFAAILCATGNFLFGTTNLLIIAQLGRVFIGFGSAFAVVSCFKLAANWFPVNRFAMLTGLMVSIGMLGAIMGEGPLAFLVAHFQWRATMNGLGAVATLIALLNWFVIQDKPQNGESEITHLIDTTQTSFRELFRDLLAIIKKPRNWFTACYGGLMFGPTSALGALWGTQFLAVRYQIAHPLAASLASLMFFGWVFGGPLFGVISDNIGRRRPPLIIGASGALISLLLIIYGPIPMWLMGVCLFLFGFLSSGFLPAFSVIREINLQRSNATALAFMNTLNMIGGAVLPPLIGHLLDLHWNRVMEGGVRVFSLQNYHSALVVLPICVAMALLVIPWIPETRCQLMKE